MIVSENSDLHFFFLAKRTERKLIRKLIYIFSCLFLPLTINQTKQTLERNLCISNKKEIKMRKKNKIETKLKGEVPYYNLISDLWYIEVLKRRGKNTDG